MTRVVKEIVVRAPPERVFEALTDPAQRAKWIASMRESGTGGPIAVGTRVEGHRTAPGSRSVYHMTVRRLEAPRVLEMDVARNHDPVGKAGYELHAAPEGTKVRGWGEVQLKGLQKLAAPMVQKGMEDELSVDLAGLKKFCEASG